MYVCVCTHARTHTHTHKHTFNKKFKKLYVIYQFIFVYAMSKPIMHIHVDSKYAKAIKGLI